MTEFKTEQEAFWAGQFGDEIKRIFRTRSRLRDKGDRGREIISLSIDRKCKPLCDRPIAPPVKRTFLTSLHRTDDQPYYKGKKKKHRLRN